MQYKFKLRGGIGLFFVFVFFSVFIFSNIAYASDTFNVGYKQDSVGLCREIGGGPLNIDDKVEIIMLDGPFIHGPAGAGEQSLITDVLNGNEIGYDTVGLDYGFGANPPLAGRFFHQRKSTLTGGQWLVVRVWDEPLPISPNAKFGESIPFSINFNFGNTQIYYKWLVDDINAVLPQAIPNEPTLVANDLPVAGIVSYPDPNVPGDDGLTKPKVTVRCSSKVGGRYYKFKLIRQGKADLDSGPIYYDNTKHMAPIVDGNLDISYTFNLDMDDAGLPFDYEVVAGNSYGETVVVNATGNDDVPPNTDNTIPFPITDLQAVYADGGITLTWSHPFDMSSTGGVGPCTAYAVVVSPIALVDLAVSPMPADKTNPSSITNWAESAVSIYNEPDFTSIIPTEGNLNPGDYGPEQQQTVEIGGTLSGAYFFAVKAKDSSDNWSYISNIAGVQIGEIIPPEVHVSNVSIDFVDPDGGGKNKDIITLSWTVDQPDKNAQIYTAANLAGPYNLLLGEHNLSATLADQTDDNIYYRIVEVGKKPIGAEDGTIASETAAKITEDLSPGGGFGINSVSFSQFSGGVNGLLGPILTLADLIKELKQQNAAIDVIQDKVTFIGYWAQGANGYYDLNEGEGGIIKGKIASTGVEEEILEPIDLEKSYQISIAPVLEDVSLAVAGKLK